MVRAGLEPAISVQTTRPRRHLPIKYLSRSETNQEADGEMLSLACRAVWLSAATTLLCGYAEFVASLFQALK